MISLAFRLSLGHIGDQLNQGSIETLDTSVDLRVVGLSDNKVDVVVNTVGFQGIGYYLRPTVFDEAFGLSKAGDNFNLQ